MAIAGVVVRDVDGKRIKCEWDLLEAAITNKTLAVWPEPKRACESIKLTPTS